MARFDNPTDKVSIATTYPDLISAKDQADAILPASEDLSTIASIVLSHATLYPETASRLSSLQTLQVPPADQSTKLIALMPRLTKFQEENRKMEEEVRQLRERSARCLEWWVQIGVVGIGDVSEAWERQVADIERNVVRWERRAKQEQGYV
jgi:hypothetical protein